VILDGIFVSYQFTKKKFSVTWPLTILRSVASTTITVLFLPISETFVTIISCTQSADGEELVIYYFPDIVCYQGWHLMHSIICTTFQLLFIAIAITVTITYYEPRMCTGSTKAKIDNYSDIVFILNKVVLQFIFAFVS
jgi:hypothetical protein